MELFRLVSTNDSGLGIQERLEEALSGLPEPKQLELLTEVFTCSAVVDDRFSELVYTAWEYICRSNLWCYRFDSLQQYRKLVSYREIIRPIIDRFKKSDRAKFSSMETIQHQWGLPVAQVLPQHIAPESWSKHLLFLLATLSKHKTRQEATELLEESINQRPRRSRQTCTLMPSDVRRALEFLSIPTRSSTRSSASSSSNENTTQVAEESLSDHHSDILIRTPSTDPMEQFINNVQEPYSYPFNCTSLSGQADDGYDCECSSICLPLKVLLDGQAFHNTDRVILQLFQWAKSVSWTSVCLNHLQRLAALRFGSTTALWPREEIIKQLEDLLFDNFLLEANASFLTELDEPLVS